MKLKFHIEIIEQLADVLNQIESIIYTEPLSVLSGSSIGQHTRHVIEFYQCLLKGVKSGTVNYDNRERNTLLETDLYYSRITLNNIIREIDDIKNITAPLRLAVNYIQNEPIYVETNFVREMVYMVEHSIHHYAIIRIALRECFNNIKIPNNFGVAYSTIRYQEALAE
jgi:hypothetical protein